MGMLLGWRAVSVKNLGIVKGSEYWELQKNCHGQRKTHDMLKLQEIQSCKIGQVREVNSKPLGMIYSYLESTNKSLEKSEFIKLEVSLIFPFYKRLWSALDNYCLQFISPIFQPYYNVYHDQQFVIMSVSRIFEIYLCLIFLPGIDIMQIKYSGNVTASQCFTFLSPVVNYNAQLYEESLNSVPFFFKGKNKRSQSLPVQEVFFLGLQIKVWIHSLPGQRKARYLYYCVVG